MVSNRILNRARPTSPKPSLGDLSTEQLLDVRLRELPSALGSALENRVAKLHSELARRRLKFIPYFWLSTEWFCPDGISGIALPFYLSHPALATLERSQMHQLEGGSERESMKILRHEAGHALLNAFGLRSHPELVQAFGSLHSDYPESYEPRPYSRRYVRHLPMGYAQSHPDEDFAETFAVWLTPGLDWRKRYAGWPALKKLETVEKLMATLRDKTPTRVRRTEVEPLASFPDTLRAHYRKKRRRFGLAGSSEFDRRLKAVFRVVRGASARRSQRAMTADEFLRKIRVELRRDVAQLAGQPQYRVDQVIQRMRQRSRDLALDTLHSPSTLRTRLQEQALHFLQTDRFRVIM